MSFKKKIAEKLNDTLDEGELSLLPRGFQTLGKIIILKLKSKLFDKKDIIAQAYLDLLPKMRAVT